MSRDIAKLPAWARTRIQVLEREIEILEGRLRAVLANKPFDDGRGTFAIKPVDFKKPLRPFYDECGIHYVPPMCKPGDWSSDARILAIRPGSGDRLEVHSSGGTLCVTPRASNVIEIGGVQR